MSTCEFVSGWDLIAAVVKTDAASEFVIAHTGQRYQLLEFSYAHSRAGLTSINTDDDTVNSLKNNVEVSFARGNDAATVPSAKSKAERVRSKSRGP